MLVNWRLSLNIFKLMFPILLGLESEGDIVFLVGLQLFSGQLEGLDIASLLQLESDWLIFGPQTQSWLVFAPPTQSWLYPGQWASRMTPAPWPLSPGLWPLAGHWAGYSCVSMGCMVTSVGGVSAPTGVSGGCQHLLAWNRGWLEAGQMVLLLTYLLPWWSSQHCVSWGCLTASQAL